MTETESVEHMLAHYQPYDFPTWQEVHDNIDWNSKPIRDFVEHVRRHGVQRPIPVDYSQDPPQVRNGHTRLLAAHKAGLDHVPVRDHEEFMDPDDPDPWGNQEGGRLLEGHQIQHEAASPRSKPIFDAEMGGPSGKLKKLMDNMDHVDPDPHLSDLYGDAKWDRDYQRLVGGRHGFQGGYEAELDNGGGIAYHKGGVWTNNTGRKIPVAHVIKPVLAANPDKMVDSDPAQEVQYFGVSSIPGDEGQLYRTLHEAVMRPNSLANRWNHPGRGYEPRPVPQGARKISVFNADNMSQDERTPSWREVGQANEEDAEGPLGEWEKANPDKRIDNNRLMSLPYGYIPWTHFPNPDDKEWPEESERFPSKANMEQNVVQPMVGIKETGDPRDITVGHDSARWPGRPWGPGDWEMTDGLTGKPTHEMVFNDEVDEHGEPVRHEAARVRPTWENRQQEPTLHSEFGSPKVRGELPSHTIHYAENGQSAACGNRNPEGSSNNVTHVTCNSCRHTVAYNMAPSPQYPNGRSYDEVTRRQKRQAAPRDFTGGHDQTKPHPSLPYAKKQGLGPGCSGSCTYGGTHCAICHEPVAYNLHTAFQYDHQGDGHPVGAGWHHADGLRRDHEAVPADPQGLIDSIPGQIAKKDQVRQQVRDHLDNQFRSIDPSYRPRPRGDEGEMPLDPFLAKAAANADESGLKAAGIAVIAMDTGRVLMQQRALNPVTCPCGQGVTWDDQNGYQHDDGSVSHDGEFAGQSVSDLLDQGHLEKEAAYEDDWNPPDAEDLGISQEELNEWQAQHPGMVATEYHGNGMMSFVDPSMREDHSEARSSNSFGNPLIEAKHALPDYGWGDLDEEGNVVPNHERFDAPQRYVDSNPVCQTCFDKHDAIRDERTHDAYQEYTRQQIDNAERYGNHHHADELRNTIHPYKPALPHPGERRLGSTVKESVQPFQQTWGYGEGHVAPYHRGDNASMDDVEGTMPGFYKRPSLYGTSLADQEAHAKIRAVRGNPDARVRVYRVVPHGISNIYGQNDLKQAFPNRDLAEWVTPSATYARDMARQPCPKCGQPSQVITGVVRAGDLLTEGYPTEFGYVGDETVPHSGTNKIFKNRCPRPVKTVEANWWEERKPAQIKETDSGGRVPFYADSYEDYEGEAPEWFRTVDPDHPNHQNPSGDSFMELKGMSDSGTPMEIDPSNGKPCETCWLGERLWGSYPPQHFEGTGHVPMEMPRYVAALYHGPEFDAEQAALTTPGAVANWVDDDHGIVHWTHPDYQRPLGSGGGHHMFSIKDDFSDYYHDPDRQSEDKDGYTDDSLLDHDTAYVHIFPKESALEHDPNEGTWEFPGGKLDPGENARQAAIREFREEVGQDLPPGVFVGAWLSPGGITVTAAGHNHVSPLGIPAPPELSPVDGEQPLDAMDRLGRVNPRGWSRGYTRALYRLYNQHSLALSHNHSRWNEEHPLLVANRASNGTRLGSWWKFSVVESEPEYNADEDYDTNRDRRNAWKQAVRHGLSMGDVTPDEARAVGYWGTGHDQGGTQPSGLKWQPLPDTLYHVTTDLPGVMQHGLKSRDELGQDMGMGLGGGESDTVSYTADPATAQRILDAMHEFHGVLNGKKSMREMYEEAQAGHGANSPYVSWIDSNEFGNHEPTRDAALAGRRWHAGLVRTQDEMDEQFPGEGWEPDTSGFSYEMPKGRLYSSWTRPMTEDEKRDKMASFYKTWAAHRAFNGGPEDPLFIMNDNKGFAAMDPSKFGIVKVHPKPGAQGYPLSALGEWRSATGQNVDIDHEMRHEAAAGYEPTSEEINHLGQHGDWHDVTDQYEHGLNVYRKHEPNTGLDFEAMKNPNGNWQLDVRDPNPRGSRAPIVDTNVRGVLKKVRVENPGLEGHAVPPTQRFYYPSIHRVTDAYDDVARHGLTADSLRRRDILNAGDAGPMLARRPVQSLSAVKPVYKGFIYLIQHEKDLDLTSRDHINPDDPDGDMTEQCAWWDIEDAKNNPALRKEVKSIPWGELELWADKSVRSNKEIKEAFAKLAAVKEEHPDPKLEPPGIVSERGDLSFGYPQPMGQYKWMPSKGPMCATCYDTNGDKVAQSEHERFLRNHDKPHHPFEKLAAVDPRPELPEGLYYQDAAESPWATQKDDEEETKFWRYRDPELVPPFNDADRWQEGVNESHGRTVDWQPMIMIKPQSEFGEDRDFDAAHHSRERTDVKWDEPICETCYLRNGSTVPAGSHWFAMDKYYNDLGQPKHDFKPLLPDVDEKGNLKQGAAGTSAEPDPYDRALAGDESKLPREPVNLPGKEDNVLPGDPAKGENWWKYKHASLKDYLAEKRGPRADAWPYVRQAIEAGKPEYIMRYLDEVDPSHHEAFMANDRPYYYEDPNFKKEDMPVVYGVRNRRETTFVAPVTHAQTGENGYLRGVAERDPSTWEFYPESQVQKAILGQPLTYRPQTPVSRANDRYQRGWASGERVPNDNMVRLDDEGHQIVQPHTDPFEEFARQVGGWSDEVPPAPPKRRPKLTAAEEPWWRF